MKRWTWVIVTVIAAAVLGAGTWTTMYLHRIARSLLDSEERLHGTILVCQPVDDHLHTNDFAEWPHSWQDLRALPARDWGPFGWPQDAARIQQLVTINFSARLDEIATQSTETFSAIQPNGPSATTYLGVGIAPLLEDIKEHAIRPRRGTAK